MTTDRELMQMALDALEWCYDVTEWPANGKSAQDKAIEALRARLAQPEQEPVWVEVTTNTGDKFILDSAVEADKIRAARDAGLLVVPLYTAPPQRDEAPAKAVEWQGLTEDDALQLLPVMPYEYEIDVEMILEFASAIEQALKEKNNAV